MPPLISTRQKDGSYKAVTGQDLINLGRRITPSSSFDAGFDPDRVDPGARQRGAGLRKALGQMVPQSGFDADFDPDAVDPGARQRGAGLRRGIGRALGAIGGMLPKSGFDADFDPDDYSQPTAPPAAAPLTRQPGGSRATEDMLSTGRDYTGLSSGLTGEAREVPPADTPLAPVSGTRAPTRVRYDGSAGQPDRSQDVNFLGSDLPKKKEGKVYSFGGEGYKPRTIAGVVAQRSQRSQNRAHELAQAKAGREERRLGFDEQRLGLEGQRLGLDRERLGLEGRRADEFAKRTDIMRDELDINRQKALSDIGQQEGLAELRSAQAAQARAQAGNLRPYEMQEQSDLMQRYIQEGTKLLAEAEKLSDDDPSKDAKMKRAYALMEGYGMRQTSPYVAPESNWFSPDVEEQMPQYERYALPGIGKKIR